MGFAMIAFIGTAVLSDHIQSHRITVPESYSDEDLDLQGKRLKGYSLGAEGLLADWYWMRSLQYVGDKIVRSTDTTINLDDLNSLNPRLLYPLLDNATDLDPKFINAFVYGAVVLPTVDPEQAIKLGWAHGALMTTFPGDTTMATLDQVRAFAKGGSARIQR